MTIENEGIRRGMQTAEGSLDYEEFTDKVNELLRKAWGKTAPVFVEEEPLGNDPSVQTVVPAITFDVTDRVRSQSHRSIDPIYFDTITDPDHPGEVVKLYRQWFDVTMEFKVFATTNREARALMNRFEGFLFQYKPYFKNLGLSDLYFEAEKKPKVESRWNRELATRTLHYFVRIERILTIRSNNLLEMAGSAVDAPAASTGFFGEIYEQHQKHNLTHKE